MRDSRIAEAPINRPTFACNLLLHVQQKLGGPVHGAGELAGVVTSYNKSGNALLIVVELGFCADGAQTECLRQNAAAVVTRRRRIGR
jgi:hypothetical protein